MAHQLQPHTFPHLLQGEPWLPTGGVFCKGKGTILTYTIDPKPVSSNTNEGEGDAFVFSGSAQGVQMGGIASPQFLPAPLVNQHRKCGHGGSDGDFDVDIEPSVLAASGLTHAQILGIAPLPPLGEGSHGDDGDDDGGGAGGRTSPSLQQPRPSSAGIPIDAGGSEQSAAGIRRASMINSFISAAIPAGVERDAATSAVQDTSPHALMARISISTGTLSTGSTDALGFQFGIEENAQARQRALLLGDGSGSALGSGAASWAGETAPGGRRLPLAVRSAPQLRVTGNPKAQPIPAEEVSFSELPHPGRSPIEIPPARLPYRSPSDTQSCTSLHGPARAGELMQPRPASLPSLLTMPRGAAVPLLWSQLRLSVTGMDLSAAHVAAEGAGLSPQMLGEGLGIGQGRHTQTSTGSSACRSLPRTSADGTTGTGSTQSPRAASLPVLGSGGEGERGGSPGRGSTVARRARQVLQQLYQSPPPPVPAFEGAGSSFSPLSSAGAVGSSLQQQWGRVLASRQRTGGGGGGGFVSSEGGRSLVSAGRSLGSTIGGGGKAASSSPLSGALRWVPDRGAEGWVPQVPDAPGSVVGGGSEESALLSVEPGRAAVGVVGGGGGGAPLLPPAPPLTGMPMQQYVETQLRPLGRTDAEDAACTAITSLGDGGGRGRGRRGSTKTECIHTI